MYTFKKVLKIQNSRKIGKKISSAMRSRIFPIFLEFSFFNTFLKVQIENKKRQLTTLFTAYIVVRFLNLQHKIQITDTSGIGFKTDNPLKTIGKLIF